MSDTPARDLLHTLATNAARNNRDATVPPTLIFDALREARSTPAEALPSLEALTKALAYADRSDDDPSRWYSGEVGYMDYEDHARAVLAGLRSPESDPRKESIMAGDTPAAPTTHDVPGKMHVLPNPEQPRPRPAPTGPARSTPAEALLRRWRDASLSGDLSDLVGLTNETTDLLGDGDD